MQITFGPIWKQSPPDAAVGILVIQNVKNPPSHPGLEARKAQVEQDIRQDYSGSERADLRSLPSLSAYDQYYRRFKKTYHLQLQLESIISGKPIPSVSALVEAMFMAELEDHLLTAGHDLDTVRPPIEIELAAGDETYTRMNGKQQTLKRGDLYIRDHQGILSSVVYGPDQRSRIQPETQNVLFTTYAVAGIDREALSAHLQRLQEYVLLVSPEANTQRLEVFDA
jgi:DNA/RNA-binding domain of Phe-tRNA-synthetase-like protein